MSKKSVPSVVDGAVSLETLVALLQRFDREHGEYPEHMHEGQAVGYHLLWQLGFTEAQIRALLGKREFSDSSLFIRRQRNHRSKLVTLDAGQSKTTVRKYVGPCSPGNPCADCG